MPPLTRLSADVSDLSDALQPDRVVTVLSISSCEEDQAALRNLFDRSNWLLMKARTCDETRALLERFAVPVVICDEALPDGTWKDILFLAAGLERPPVLIVTSRFADDSLWAEVLNLGGYNVLDKPFDRMELSRVVSLAWLYWKANRQNAAFAVCGA